MNNDAALQCRKLVVKRSQVHGYGVFAEEYIHAGDVIEECYSIIVENYKQLENFTYHAGENGLAALVLGNGSIYNHLDDHANAIYDFDLERQVMTYSAVADIKPGDEIFVNYGSTWFSSRNATVKKPSKRYYIRRFLRNNRTFVRGLFVAATIIASVMASRAFLATL